jgi:hypothetical protein
MAALRSSEARMHIYQSTNYNFPRDLSFIPQVFLFQQNVFP